MNRTLLGAGAFAGALFTLASTAQAQSGRTRNFESPQHFAVELRMGLYYPKVDNEFAGQRNGGATPFRDAFGDNSRFTVGAEFDWQAYRIPYVGTIGPGIGVHYLKFGRPALLRNGLPSEEETSLQIYPMHLWAVLRVDVLMRETGIPIVPYLKGGLGWALWRMSNGTGTSEIKRDVPDPATGGTTQETEAVGKGISYGPQFALGGALLLDWFDEYAARQADQALGINNTYFFAEYVSSHLSNINGTGLQVGTNMVTFGLAFEF